jgi:cation-transporting ATPase 13A1
LIASKSIVKASLHRKLPTYKHAYATPFILLYIIWLFIYFFAYDELLGSEELTFLTLGGLISLNGLTFLITQWSVLAYVKLTCKEVKLIKEADIIRIVPLEHKGKSTICEIQHNKVS